MRMCVRATFSWFCAKSEDEYNITRKFIFSSFHSTFFAFFKTPFMWLFWVFLRIYLPNFFKSKVFPAQESLLLDYLQDTKQIWCRIYSILLPVPVISISRPAFMETRGDVECDVTCGMVMLPLYLKWQNIAMERRYWRKFSPSVYPALTMHRLQVKGTS